MTVPFTNLFKMIRTSQWTTYTLWVLITTLVVLSIGDAVENGSCVEQDGSKPRTNSDAPSPSDDPTKESLLLSNIDLGVSQWIDNGQAEEVNALIETAKHYLYHEIAMNPKKRHLLESCKLRNERCAHFAVTGGCESDFMQQKCAPICGSCEKIPLEERCPIDETSNVWKAGDLNRFFGKLTIKEDYKQYEPRVLSRPEYLSGDTEENADYKIGPWIVVLENVLSEEEAQRLIELGATEGYKHSRESTATGTRRSNTRTSQNSWCKEACYRDPAAKRINERIANITSIPETNYEYLQMLKYEQGEYYHSHLDYIHHFRERQPGVRIMTFFLYLNDMEEDSGGGTDFTKLGITVQPKRGRAVVFPHVLNEAPDKVDTRTIHRALEVKGEGSVKYGANAFIHQRDFKTPHANKCV